MLQLKDLRGRALGEKILEELEETTWRASMFCRAPLLRQSYGGQAGIVPTKHRHYNILVPYVNDYL